MVSELGRLYTFPGESKSVIRSAENHHEIKNKNAKTFFVNQHCQVLILVRSNKEDSRIGESDIPGGKFEIDNDDPVKVAIEEAGQELPGIVVRHIEPIYQHLSRKPENGTLWMSHFFAGIADFPKGIITSDEHSGHFWVPSDSLSALKIPEKYVAAASFGAPVLDRLAELCQPNNQHLIPEIGRSALEINEAVLAA